MLQSENKKNGPFQKMTPQLIEQLKGLLGTEHLVLSRDDLEPFSHDETEDLVFWPEIGVQPRTLEEIEALLRFAQEKQIPITPRGGGTGLSGGALPIAGGIVLSLDKMNKILEIDPANRVAVVEPGVITEVLQQEVEGQGLFYPPDPASRGSCTIGGNVAENAGGPHALKYGTTKDWVLGMTALTPAFGCLDLGGKLYKNATGFSLAQLLVGSEGTLAVVGKVILKLVPKPAQRVLLWAPFADFVAAARVIPELSRRGILPAAVEILERRAPEAAARHLGIAAPVPIGEANLLIEIDGNDEALLEKEMLRVGEVVEGLGAGEVVAALEEARCQELWKLRRTVGEAVKSLSVYKEEDTVVPPARLPELIAGVRRLTAKHGVEAICYGHAGDGNLHVNLLKMGLSEEEWNHRLPRLIQELFAFTVSLGGMITGEHGVGWTQRAFLPLALSPAEIALMRQVKQLFDPQGILNPGKIFP